MSKLSQIRIKRRLREVYIQVASPQRLRGNDGCAIEPPFYRNFLPSFYTQWNIWMYLRFYKLIVRRLSMLLVDGHCGDRYQAAGSRISAKEGYF